MLRAWWNRLSSAWKDSLIIWLVGRIFFSAWGAVLWLMGLPPKGVGPFHFGIQPVEQGLAGIFLGVWQRWDSIHYQSIAMNGYTNDFASVFFPLYPFLARGLHLMGLDVLIALMLVSNVALLFAMVLLYRLAEELFSAETARNTLICLLLYPASFFLYALYPQSLALLLALAAIWFARKDRWIVSALAGLLAGLTHSTGLAVVAAVGWEAWLRVRVDKKRWPVGLAALAPIAGVGLFFALRVVAGFPSAQAVLSNTYGRAVRTTHDRSHAVGDRPRANPGSGVYPMGYQALAPLRVVVSSCAARFCVDEYG